jgi:hypothetical protein
MTQIKKITPTHQNIFTGKKVQVMNYGYENTTYLVDEPIFILNLFIQEFTKPNYAFKQCYEKLS